MKRVKFAKDSLCRSKKESAPTSRPSKGNSLQQMPSRIVLRLQQSLPSTTDLYRAITRALYFSRIHPDFCSRHLFPCASLIVKSLNERGRLDGFLHNFKIAHVGTAIASLATKWDYEQINDHVDTIYLSQFCPPDTTRDVFQRVYYLEWCIFFALDCNLFPFSC